MLTIDTNLIIVFFIIWVLVAVLSKFFFKPLRKTMEKRKTTLEENRKGTESSLAGYEQTSLQIEEKLRAARAEAQDMRDKFEQEGLRKKELTLEETHEECREQVEEAKKKLNRRLEGLKKELEPRSKQLAQRIEQRLLS